MTRRKGEPRFDLDLPYGRQAELLIGDYLDWIANRNGRVEVKRKRYLDLEFYIETACDYGRAGVYQPSGISITTAAAWAFVIGETDIAVIVPTALLRECLEATGARDYACTQGDCPTRGKLVNFAMLLYRYRQRRDHPPPATAQPRPPAPPTGPVPIYEIPWGRPVLLPREPGEE